VQVRQKNFVVGALAAILVLALWYTMLYSPMTSKASKANQAAAAAQAKVKSLQAEADRLSPNAPDAKSAKQQQALLNAAIPSDPAEAAFLRDLDSLKAATGVSVQTVTPQSPTSGSGTTTISVNLVVQGGEAQVLDYVQRLGGLKRLFVVDGINFAPGSAGPGGSGGAAGKVFASQSGGATVQATIAGRIFTQEVLLPASSIGGAARPSAPAASH
jgi:Tfp pilus assembly protein PilO